MQHGNYDVDLDQRINWKVVQIIWPYLMEHRSRVFFALGCLVFAKLAMSEGVDVDRRLDASDLGGRCVGAGGFFGFEVLSGAHSYTSPDSVVAGATK